MCRDIGRGVKSLVHRFEQDGTDAKENAVDAQALRVFALRQPMADDLRAAGRWRDVSTF